MENAVQSVQPYPKRSPIQDIVKALAIILVVFGHMERGFTGAAGETLQALKIVDFIIYTTHMPVFFLLAGYNAERSIKIQTSRAYCKSRLGRIIFPYLFWSLAFALFQWAGSFITTINNPIALSAVVSILWTPYSVFWFLYSLFVLQILTTTFQKNPIILLLSSLATSMLAMIFPTYLPNIVATTCVHFPYFAIGYFLANTYTDIEPSKDRLNRYKYPALAIFIFGNIAALLLSISQPVSFIMIPVSLAGIIILMNCSFVIAKHSRLAQYVTKIGHNSFQIYILHLFFLPIASRLCMRMGISSHALILAFATIFGVYGSIWLYAFLQKIGLENVFALSGRLPNFKLQKGTT